MNTKRPILLMHTKSVWGGAQKYVYDLAKGLEQQDEFVLVASGGNGPLKERIEELGVPYHALQAASRDVSFLKEIKLTKELFLLFRNLQPRIIHLNGSKLGTLGAMVAKLALGRRVRVIYSTHGFPLFEPRPFVQKILIWITLQIASLFQDHIIGISYRDTEAVKRMLFFTKHKTSYIPISIDPTTYTFLGSTTARKNIAALTNIAISEKTVIVGTIAERTRNKALHTLIAAAKHLDNPHLLFVLFGWGEETKKLEQLITNLQLTNVFLCDGKDAPKLLKGFDIFTLPSVKEGLPYTLLEAGLAELPLIGTYVGGIPEVVRNKQTGILVTPNHPAELARAIDALATSPELRKTYGLKARDLVCSEFTFKKMFTKTMKCYASVS